MLRIALVFVSLLFSQSIRAEMSPGGSPEPIPMETEVAPAESPVAQAPPAETEVPTPAATPEFSEAVLKCREEALALNGELNALLHELRQLWIQFAQASAAGQNTATLTAQIIEKRNKLYAKQLELQAKQGECRLIDLSDQGIDDAASLCLAKYIPPYGSASFWVQEYIKGQCNKVMAVAAPSPPHINTVTAPDPLPEGFLSKAHWYGVCVATVSILKSSCSVLVQLSTADMCYKDLLPPSGPAIQSAVTACTTALNPPAPAPAPTGGGSSGGGTTSRPLPRPSNGPVLTPPGTGFPRHGGNGLP